MLTHLYQHSGVLPPLFSSPLPSSPLLSSPPFTTSLPSLPLSLPLFLPSPFLPPSLLPPFSAQDHVGKKGGGCLGDCPSYGAFPQDCRDTVQWRSTDCRWVEEVCIMPTKIVCQLLLSLPHPFFILLFLPLSLSLSLSLSLKLHVHH